MALRKILLVHPRQSDMLYANMKRAYHMRRYPPLGLMYISASLENKGYSTDIIDTTIIPISSQDLVNKIRSEDYLFVGFYADMATKNSVLEYLKLIKSQLNIPTVIGGPASLSENGIFHDTVDIICNGEGDLTILDIADCLEGKLRKSEIRGITYPENGKMNTNPPRELISNLNRLPFPARKKLPFDKYYDRYIFTVKEPYTTLITSRGCPMNCTYCASSQFWKRKVRRRSVENVIAEIEEVYEQYRVKYIDIIDDTFTLDNKWLVTFCDQLIRKDFKFNWSCINHPHDMPEELLIKMKRAGCDTLKIGLQSADPVVLKEVNRDPRSPEKALELVKKAKSIGFMVLLDFIFGLPGEDEETIKRNISFSLSANPTFAKFYKLAFLEGSELYSKREEKIHNLSAKKIDELCRIAWRKFYFRLSKAWELSIWFYKNPRMLKNFIRYFTLLIRF